MTLLDTVQIAAILKVSPRTVQRMVVDGKIKTADSRKPRGWFFDPDDLWPEERESGSAEG